MANNSNRILVHNVVSKFRDAFEAYRPNIDNVWAEVKAPADITGVSGNAVGASYLVLSKDPLNAGTTTTVTTYADVASAALTTTTTTAALTPTPPGGAATFTIGVTAVTGTTPTLDIGIEESDDGGLNWFRVYDFPRITATGTYRSPTIPLVGNRVRYVQTVSGSFTRAISRTAQLNITPSPYRQTIDRALAVNTLSSATAGVKTNGAGLVQLVVNMGAITTTAPQLQLDGSDDNGITWYSIGSPLTTVASSTVQTTVVDVNAELVRARVSTAGVGATLGYVLLKAHN